jgi:bile acid:Na+ symporter, BASS family
LEEGNIMDPVSVLRLGIATSIVLVVLGLGLRATWSDTSYLLRHRGLLIRSLLAMSVIMPLVAAGLVVAFELPTPVKIALVALAVSPVPPLLPNKELKAGGQASYAIGLLVVIALLAIVTVPIAVSWFGSAFNRSGEIAPGRVAGVVLSSILVPLAVGIAVRQWAPALAEKAARPLAIVGMVLLIVSASPLLYVAWPAAQAQFGNGTLLIISAMALIGLTVGHLLGGPDAETRTVLALSTTSRHPAVALAIAAGAGLEVKSALAAVLSYVIVAVLVSIPYVMWQRRRSGNGAAAMPSASRSQR